MLEYKTPQRRGWLRDRSSTGGVMLAVTFLVTTAHVAALVNVPTFTHDVAPILSKNCLRCHEPDGIAYRVPLTSYEAAQERADKIKEKVVSRQMPPWPADPAKSVKFRNDARLSQKDIDMIVAWVNAGAPKGDDADLPAMPKSKGGWMHPQGRDPDFVISLPGDVHLPAKQELPYVRVMVKVPFADDHWIAASQTLPSNPAVVHHMALTEVELPNGMTPADIDRVAALERQMGVQSTGTRTTPAVVTPPPLKLTDMLGIYTPGSALEMYPDGSSKLLRGGDNVYLIFNIHYETTDKPEIDRSRIAFWFEQGSPKHQLFRVNGAGEVILANGKELVNDAPGVKAEGTHVAIPPIPPGAENYELVGITAYPEAVTIYQMQPHAHHRAKDFTYTAVYPDGHEETLLTVPQYDHRWQMAYEPETPIKLPAGSKLVVTAHYDNSTMNMHNPAPEKEVYFRDQNQSWDEMFTPFIQVSFDDEDPSKRDSGQAMKATDKRLEIGEVVGCLTGTSGAGWSVVNASEPAISESQATTSSALNTAKSKASGKERYHLLGIGIFQPEQHRGKQVAVKGVLIKDPGSLRINVTSLQEIGACSGPHGE
ncbi:MAG TPA: hypothetical protein VF753_15800 [Terriglobales bacterium]